MSCLCGKHAATGDPRDRKSIRWTVVIHCDGLLSGCAKEVQQNGGGGTISFAVARGGGGGHSVSLPWGVSGYKVGGQWGGGGGGGVVWSPVTR